MDSGRLAVLLALLLLALGARGQAGGAGKKLGGVGARAFLEEENGRPSGPEAQTPASLLRALLQALKRPGRSQAFLFQPQRFGRDDRRSPGKQGLSPQSAEGPSPRFWSLAAPQRFGKK
ncbi:pro-FMRFamide-related neuropeptide FF [Monodelphis domestica]|uniref:pro-FMRFamide-related neuropeptide FF n=1 Tax=Monodelphis domestica TaxID=13616 RepID=UPI0024E1B4BA|nr:pro-FMRFamide-related neuropeptide FF [Monodelphis domestica]